MPSLIKPAILIALCCVCSAPMDVYCQSGPVKPPADSRQFQSHQMNQPPPDDSKRMRLSGDVVDDIMRLYDQARKELEAKPTAPAPPAQ
jgi:hypothetical protein